MNVFPVVQQSLGGVLDGLRGAFDFVSGVNDVIVVRHPDGSVYCSTFCVQTNAATVNRHMLGQNVVFELNGRPTGLEMYVADDGRCLFRDCAWDSGGTIPDLPSLARLAMRDGRNAMDFRIGEAIVASAALFCWSSGDMVVVVDIDGTITQTDVGGVVTTSELGQQILGQQLGVTHSHPDVCEAMSLLACAGYRLLFLTARPLTRAHATRRYLASIGRTGGAGAGIPMPDGALIASTKGTLGTIASIWGDIKSYKLGALREVQALFAPPGPPGGTRTSTGSNGGGFSGGTGQCNFAGGFGNHGYDTQAYLEAGCPHDRVFQIDDMSNITVASNGYVHKGYTGLIPALPDLFPPVVVVQWERSKAAGGGPASQASTQSFLGSSSLRSAPPLSSSLSPGGGVSLTGSPGGGVTPLGGHRNQVSYSKIPGPEVGLGKVWQSTAPPPSLSKMDLYYGGPPAGGNSATYAAGGASPAAPLSAAGGVGNWMEGRSVDRGPAHGNGAAAAAAPPAYDSAEGQGLIDLGVEVSQC